MMFLGGLDTGRDGCHDSNPGRPLTGCPRRLLAVPQSDQAEAHQKTCSRLRDDNGSNRESQGVTREDEPGPSAAIPPVGTRQPPSAVYRPIGNHTKPRKPPNSCSNSEPNWAVENDMQRR